MSAVEYREGTPAEVADVARQIEGVPAGPLFQITFHGHMVPNPDGPGTLAPAITGHTFRAHPSLPGPVATGMLPVLLRRLLAQLEGGGK